MRGTRFCVWVKYRIQKYVIDWSSKASAHVFFPTCKEVFREKKCPFEATVFVLCVLTSALFGKFNLNYFCKLTAMLFGNFIALIQRSLIRNLFTGKSFIPATKKPIWRVLSSCEIPSMRESSLENKLVDHLSHRSLTYCGHKCKLKRLGYLL